MKVYVPINEKGIKELDSLQETETDNLKIYEFLPKDYFYLEEHKYFDFLNVECECLIDLYEEADILNGKLTKAVEITSILIHQINEERFSNLAQKLIGIYELAIKSCTYVSIYCYGDPEIINE